MHPGVHVRWLLSVGVSALASSLHAPVAHSAHQWADAAALLQTRAEPSITALLAAEEARRGSGRIRGDPTPQTMINFGDAQYISYLRIGKQILAGMLDTGSFELVVFGADCRTCGVAAHYNPSLSSTFRSGRLASQQAFGSGSCYSTASADVLQIGSFSEARQSFWTVQQANMPTLTDAAFEALIGLGPPEAPSSDAWKAVSAVISNITSFYDLAEKAPGWLMTQVDKRLEIADEMSVKTTLLNNLDVSDFSVCFGATARSNGIIVWNDAAFMSQPDIFTRVMVSGRHTWSTNLTNPILLPGNSSGPRSANESVGLGCIGDTGCAAILDTGMSLIAAPRPVIDALRQAMLQLEPDCSNMDVLPDLVFELGGMTFSLPPEAYVAAVEGTIPDHLAKLIEFNSSSTCQLLLIESFAVSDSGPLWILGMPFFRKYYTTFHLGATREERSFYIAEAGQDCSAAGPGEAAQETESNRRSLLRRVDLQKVHLPQTARIAMREQFARL